MCDTLDVLFPIFTTVPQKTPNPLDVLFIIYASSSRTPNPLEYWEFYFVLHFTKNTQPSRVLVVLFRITVL